MTHSKKYGIRGWVAVVLSAMGLLCMSACSTQKNTALSRSYHQTKVRYNIFYNGNIAYEAGLQAINEACEDDYSQIIPLYPVSDHNAAQASASQMDKTIEKCRKCIKLHSIKAKPKPNPKKRNDPKYKLWLQQEEFNNQMGNVWIRLGEAEFHKGDFLGAIGTFNYVARHYEYDADMVARCGLWTARAFAEMGWLYEAEDALNKVQIDALSRKHASLYAAVSADIKVKTGQYKEAIPFLKIATPDEKRKLYRPRFQYILAQLLEKEGKSKQAADAYLQAARMAPKVEMEFNARLRAAQLSGQSGLKKLEKMAKLSKNKDLADQIYGAIGNIYLAAGDTAAALSNYQTAIEKSTQGGTAKGAILVTAGDLYFDRREYASAQPLYAEATGILSAEAEDYKRIEKRSQILDELIIESNTVTLQDSLQRLSRLSEEEQMAVAKQLVEDLMKAEKEAEEKAALAAREAEQSGLQGVDTRNMIGGGGQNAEWYFYNAQLLRGGKQDFVKRWGTRALEDNWRRLSKTSSSSFVAMGEDGQTPDEDDEQSEGVSSAEDSLKTAPVSDPHKAEYYLQQIPKTEEEIAASDSLIATALANTVYIYQTKLEDTELANETLEELESRYPNDGHLLDLYYMKYLESLASNENVTEQGPYENVNGEKYKQLILDKFPKSKQAYIVSQPDYFDRLRRMAGEQDSLYEATYTAYNKGELQTVKKNNTYAKENYPLSPLMPRFAFLNAIAVAKTEGQDAFIGELQNLVATYPESELGAMAKDFLAMMGQGMESQKGTSSTSLADLRNESANANDGDGDGDDENEGFSSERKTASYVMLLLGADKDEAELNNLLYQVALFNFSQFLIRDFDLQRLPAFDAGSAIRIAGLDSMDEADWYVGLMEKNSELMTYLRQIGAEVLCITEENAALIKQGKTVAEYREFAK